MSKTAWSCSFFSPVYFFSGLEEREMAYKILKARKTPLLREARCDDMPYAANPFTSCLARSRIP